MTDTSQLCELVAKNFHQYNLIKSCLPASIILSELLKVKGTSCNVAIGYAVGKSLKLGFRHVWVVTSDMQELDVGLNITQLHDSSYPDWYYLSESFPSDYDRLDLESTQDVINNDQFENALNIIKKSGTKSYWKGFATPPLNRLRKLLHRSLSHKTSSNILKRGCKL